MALKAAISIEEYLATSYEHDREYVHGEIVERGMPTYSHSRIQLLLGAWFLRYEKTLNLFAAPELRMRIAEGVIRIPDLAVFLGRPEELPVTPPIVTVEISSPDDRLSETLDKLSEYRDWGVPHVWLINAQRNELFVFEGSLIQTPAFELPEFQLKLTREEIFS